MNTFQSPIISSVQRTMACISIYGSQHSRVSLGQLEIFMNAVHYKNKCISIKMGIKTIIAKILKDVTTLDVTI